MTSRTIQLDEVGDLAAEPGSRKWAIAVKSEIEAALHNVEFGAEQLDAFIRMMEERKGYTALGFRSFEEFCETPPPAGLGKSRISINIEIDNRKIAQQRAEQAQPLGINGRHSSSDNYKRMEFGTDPTYLTARIARDRPDILADMKAGKYRSVRQAAIKAGIVKNEKRISIPIDPDAAARAIRRHFSDDQIDQLINLLS